MNESRRGCGSSAARSPTRRRRVSSLAERGPARRLSWLRPLAVAFAILVVALAGVLALSPMRAAPSSRSFASVAIVERVETLPDVRAQRLDFGERVSREAAERRAGFDVLDLGTEPDAIFIRPDGLVSVVYGNPSRPRLVLSQARAAIYDGFIKQDRRPRHDHPRDHGRRRTRALRLRP